MPKATGTPDEGQILTRADQRACSAKRRAYWWDQLPPNQRGTFDRDARSRYKCWAHEVFGGELWADIIVATGQLDDAMLQCVNGVIQVRGWGGGEGAD